MNRSKGCFASLSVLFACAAFAAPTRAQVVSTSAVPYFHFESGPVAPLRLTPDGRRLLVVNPGDDRLEIWAVGGAGTAVALTFEGSVFTGLDPVAIALDPADPAIAYVANELSDSISVVDLDDRVVTGSVRVGDEPHDVAVAAGRLFVGCARAQIDWVPGGTSETTPENVVVVWDLASPANAPQLHVVPIHGHTPRSLAVSADGSRLFVAPQNSGNDTSVIRIDRAVSMGLRQEVAEPGETFTVNPILTSPIWNELSNFLQLLLNRPLFDGWRIPGAGRIVPSSHPDASFHPDDHDVIAIDTATLAAVAHARGVAGSILALERRPGATDELWVAGTIGRNLVRFEPELRGTPMRNVVVKLSGAGAMTVQQTFELAPPVTSAEHAQPVAIAFDERKATGRVFVATLGSSSIVALDPASGVGQAFAAGDLPMGLAFDATRGVLFAYCRGDSTLRAFDVDHGGTELLVQPLDYNPEPPLIAAGRRTLYGATTASGRGTGNASCASCHLFGHQDQMAWDLGNPEGGLSPIYPDSHFPAEPMLPVHSPLVSIVHPMKGPMVTQSLRGIAGDEPLHWRGDRRAFQAFRGAFRSLLGGNGISSAEMQAYTTFVGTLAHRPNPFQPKERVYGPVADAGRLAFGEGDAPGDAYSSALPGLRCDTCHFADFARGNFTGSALFVVEDGGDSLFNPSLLRSIYEKNHPELTGFGTLHEGSMAGVRGFLSEPVFDLVNSDPQKFAAMIEFTNQFDTGVAPIVGEQFLATAGHLPEAKAWLDRAEAAALRGECDVIGKGWVWSASGREPHGGLFSPSPDGSPQWWIDNGGVLTRDDLLALYVEPGGAEVQFTCVLPTHGRRLGIDQDEDGLLDYLEWAGYRTDPSDPDSDDDGYSDFAELFVLSGDPLIADARLADSVKPTVTGQGVLFSFVESATIWAVVDEPATLLISVRDEAGTEVAVARSDELRVLHGVVVDGLPAGASLTYSITAIDRNGNTGSFDQGELSTFTPFLHVSEISVEVAEQRDGLALVHGKVTIVDQDGAPVVGIPVSAAWDAEGFAALGDWFDAFAFSMTDSDGVAFFEKWVVTPDSGVAVTLSPVTLGSASFGERWYPGTQALTDQDFFYDESSNERSFATLFVK